MSTEEIELLSIEYHGFKVSVKYNHDDRRLDGTTPVMDDSFKKELSDAIIGFIEEKEFIRRRYISRKLALVENGMTEQADYINFEGHITTNDELYNMDNDLFVSKYNNMCRLIESVKEYNEKNQLP